MTTATNSLNDLLPEIFPIIASHLPLYSTPSTLLSLALTNRQISDIVLPVLRSRLILTNENDALAILQKLSDDPSFGLAVRELHIMSALSEETRKRDPPLDVLRLVEEVILKGRLPFIHTLGLYLTDGWYEYYIDGVLQTKMLFGWLSKGFWDQLREKCPRLRGLVLRGFTQRDDRAEWIEESGILQCGGITSLDLHFDKNTLSPSGCGQLFRHISSLAHSLHTLHLSPGPIGEVSFSPIFRLYFPCLRVLSIKMDFAPWDSDAMARTAFFYLHPTIEFLSICSSGYDRDCFVAGLFPGLLPNLVHLRADWKEVRRLVPTNILQQLVSLSIHHSVNGQIPYLLRELLPDGLPNLRSLGIGQGPHTNKFFEDREGSRWYEDEDGIFCHSLRGKEERTIFSGYMHSIARATPNLEELAFYGFCNLSYFSRVASDLNRLSKLKDLYYVGHWLQRMLFADDIHKIAVQATSLMEEVPGLVSITSMLDDYHFPYLTARRAAEVKKSESGEDVGVRMGRGYGMKFGNEDDAFPWRPLET